MLSPKTQQLLDELHELIAQREEIDRKIEALFGGTMTLVPQSASSPTQLVPRRKGRKPKSEAQAEAQPRGEGRRMPRPSKFTDAQIEQMIRESDEGKSAEAIAREYGFSSIGTWYQLKSKYKRGKAQGRAASADLPAYDASDDEEAPDDASAERLHLPDNLPTPPKRYSYECSCGYSFKSGMPPTLVKCPDCKRKPRLSMNQTLTNDFRRVSGLCA